MSKKSSKIGSNNNQPNNKPNNKPQKILPSGVAGTQNRNTGANPISNGQGVPSLASALAYCVVPGDSNKQHTLVPIINELLNIRKGTSVIDQGFTLDRYENEVFKLITKLQNKINTILGRKESQSELCLVYGGATKIKSYVFESSEIAEIRGASAILDWLNTEVPRAFVDENKLPKDCILYSSGGNIVAFTPLDLGDKFARYIEKKYTTETLTGQSIAVSTKIRLIELAFGRNPDAHTMQAIRSTVAGNAVVYKLLQQSYAISKADTQFDGFRDNFSKIKGFGELITVVASMTAARRDGEHSDAFIRPIEHEELTPWVTKCHTSDIRPASVMDGSNNKGERISLSTERKRAVGRAVKHIRTTNTTSDGWKLPNIRSWDKEYSDFLSRKKLVRKNLENSDTVRPAHSFEQIAQACKQGTIGVIYADGNNLGQRYSTMTTPKEYRDFSDLLTRRTKEIVFEALYNHITYYKSGNEYIQPFEIIAIGGDDCFIIVPGDVALQVAYDIGNQFNDVELRLDTHIPHRFGISATKKPKLTLSAGVVIADHKTPFFLLERLVNDLLKSAKKAARSYQTGTVDFISLMSLGAVSDSVEAIRQAYTYGDGSRLTARPYTWEELNFILERTSAINKGLAGESFNSHLYRIASVMHTQGRLASDLELQSTIFNSQKNNNILQGIALAARYLSPQSLETNAIDLNHISLWHMHQQQYETILIDLMEIRDLV
jgi:CRISPR-associated protein Cmr2